MGQIWRWLCGRMRPKPVTKGELHASASATLRQPNPMRRVTEWYLRRDPHVKAWIAIVVVGFSLLCGFGEAIFGTMLLKVGFAVCYVVVAVFAILILWEELKRWRTTRIAIITAATLLFAAGAFASWRFSIHPANVNMSTTNASIPSSSPAYLEMSYEINFFGLPILIPPNTTMPIIRIHKDRKVDSLAFVNESSHAFKWPTKERILPSESVGVIELSNHGNADLFDISATVTFNIGAQKGPGGTSQVRLELPLVANLNVGGNPVNYYVVNESPDAVIVALPQSVMAQLQGEDRRTIGVEVRQITFFDKIPMLLPSWHKWIGDTMLQPSQIRGRK